MDTLFKYYFQNQIGDYYYIDPSGALQTTSVTTALEDDPKGWDKATVQFNRGEISHGIFRKGTEVLQFHRNAAKILRYIYYQDQFDGYLKLTVDKQNRDFDNNNWSYDLWYACEIDLGSAKDGSFDNEESDVYFNAKLLELGLPAIIEANRDKTYEIAIYPIAIDPDAIEIEIKDMRMDSHYEYVIPETLDINGNDIFDSGDYSPVMGVIKQDQVFEVIEAVSQVDIGAGVTNTYFAKAVQLNDSVIKINFNGEYKNITGGTTTIGYDLQLMVFEPGNPVPVNSGTMAIWTDSQSLAAGATKPFIINVTYPYTLAPGYVVVLRFFQTTGAPGSGAIRVSADGEATIDTVYVTPASRCAGFRYIDLAKKLLNNMITGSTFGVSPYTVVSDILNDNFLSYFTRPFNNIVVPAASIRNLPDPKIKTSWTDLMKDLEIMFGCGYGIEGNNVRIEPKAKFYRKDVALTSISINSTVEKVTAIDYIYNSVNIGFNDTAVDEINGLQEFCCEQKYLCGLKSSSVSGKEFPLVSPYIHGCYSIENFRSFVFRSDTTSTPTDNDICVIEVNVMSGGIYEPNKAGFDGTTFKNGLKYPADVYNIGHSPKACLLRNMDYIKSYLTNGKVIDFLTATKNATVNYGDTTLVITESSDIEITSNGAKDPDTGDLYPNISRIFLPYYFNFKGQMPTNLINLMEEPDSGTFKKYGIMNVYDGVASLDMFVLDVGVTPATNDVYQIRGLCSPDTDLSQLIR